NLQYKMEGEKITTLQLIATPRDSDAKIDSSLAFFNSSTTESISSDWLEIIKHEVVAENQ
ncbi:34934_t:CDS:1, partial [Gigaspora margarita]